MNYVSNFLKYNCASDILKIIEPINNLDKEISEAYTILKTIKKAISPADSRKLEILDLCAGNGLLGVSIAYLFHFIKVTSYDIKRPNREFEKVNNYEYVQADITKFESSFFEGKIIIANHPCRKARDIINFFLYNKAKALILMPCCVGKLRFNSQFIRKKLGKYNSWCIDLWQDILLYNEKYNENIECRIEEDKNCLSPCNIVITAIRKR